jgi:hypothetical protein
MDHSMGRFSLDGGVKSDAHAGSGEIGSGHCPHTRVPKARITLGPKHRTRNRCIFSVVYIERHLNFPWPAFRSDVTHSPKKIHPVLWN